MSVFSVSSFGEFPQLQLPLQFFFSLNSCTSSRFLGLFCNVLATIPGPGALQTIWSVVPLPMMMQRATVFRPLFFVRVGTTLWASSCNCSCQVWSRDNWDSAVFFFHAIYFGTNDAICNVQCSTLQVFFHLCSFKRCQLAPTVAEHVGCHTLRIHRPLSKSTERSGSPRATRDGFAEDSSLSLADFWEALALLARLSATSS